MRKSCVKFVCLFVRYYELYLIELVKEGSNNFEIINKGYDSMC